MFTHGLLQRHTPWMRRLAAALTLAVGLIPFTFLAAAAQAQGMIPGPAPVRSLLLFPSNVAATAAGVPKALPGRLDDAIKLRLNLIGYYSTLTYTKFLPAVQRALLESDNGGLTEGDVEPPFDVSGAGTIAALVGTDAYLFTTVESYHQSAATRRVTVLVDSAVYYSKTGNRVPGLGGTFSGVAGPTSASDTNSDIEQGAINDVAARIVSSMNTRAAKTRVIVDHSSQRGTSKGVQTVVGTLLVGLLAYAILQGSHIGGGGGNNNNSGTSVSSTSTGSPPGAPGSTGTSSGTGSSGPPPPP